MVEPEHRPESEPRLEFEGLVALHRPVLESHLAQLAAAPVLGLRQRHCLPKACGPAAGQAALAALLVEQNASGGKRLRGILPMAIVSACGGSSAAALDLAAAIELAHNGTLVHDDVQDNDRLRRGQPTLWTIFGIPQAINAGDALMVAPIGLLLRSTAIDPAVVNEIAALLAEALVETVRGQVADIGLREEPEVTLDLLTGIHLAKTAPLFGVCLQGSALVLGLPAAAQAQAQLAASSLGLAFQVRDDLLDVAGNKGRGHAGADLREGKVTVPALFASQVAPAHEFLALRTDLARAASQLTLDDATVAHWVQWIVDHGGAQRAQLWLAELLSTAEEAGFAAFGPDGGQVVAALCRRLARLDG